MKFLLLPGGRLATLTDKRPQVSIRRFRDEQVENGAPRTGVGLSDSRRLDGINA
jgi:hypothetical protein